MRYFAKIEEKYINYVCLKSNPLRLANTSNSKKIKNWQKMKHIVYNEKEIDIIKNLHTDIEIIEIN
jgi:hypothetical protein